MGKDFHAPPDKEQKQMSVEFSVFPPGYINRYGKAVMATTPIANTTLDKVYEFISNEKYAGKATQELREITEHDANSCFKMMNFYFATFSCMATYRKADSVTSITPYIVIDIDKDDLMKAYAGYTIEEAIEDLKGKLIADKNLATVLVFLSPNGNGLKIVLIVEDETGLSHKEKFDAISCYISQRYGVQIDKSGSDICRACFLPYDPDCYFDANYLTMEPSSIDLGVWLEEKRKMADKERRSQANANAAHQTSGHYSDVYELVERWVSQDVAYATGTYNRYVSKCGYLLCEFGVSEAEATQWAINRFSDYQSSDVKSIFRSCYRYGNFGKREFINNQNKNQ